MKICKWERPTYTRRRRGKEGRKQMYIGKGKTNKGQEGGVKVNEVKENV